LLILLASSRFVFYSFEVISLNKRAGHFDALSQRHGMEFQFSLPGCLTQSRARGASMYNSGTHKNKNPDFMSSRFLNLFLNLHEEQPDYGILQARSPEAGASQEQ
jgi:hypothetical protein